MQDAFVLNAWSDDAELPFKPLPPAATQWLNELPITDISRCCELVFPTLQLLNKQSMTAITRFKILEAFRPVVFLLSQKQEPHFVGSRFPPDRTTYEPAKYCIHFHLELARGYKLVSLDQSFADPETFTDFQRAATIHQALQSFALSVMRQAQFYQAPKPDFWGQIYGLYRSAERFQLQELLVEDKETETESSIGHAFKGILLLVLSDTKYYQQHDILKIYNLLAQFAKYSELATTSSENQKTASFCLDIDANEPPKLVQNEAAVENGGNYFLFTHNMVETIIRQVNHSTLSSVSGAKHALPDKTILKSVLQRLGSPQKRKFTRFAATTEKRKMIVGLDQLTAVFSGDITDSTPAQAKTEEGTDQANDPLKKPNSVPDYDLVPIEQDLFDQAVPGSEGMDCRSINLINIVLDESCARVRNNDIWKVEANQKNLYFEDVSQNTKVTNSSANGYGMIYPYNDGSKIKVGDIVGVYETISQIEVGLICWLDYSDDGVLSFGIKLLSPIAEVAHIGRSDAQDTEMLSEQTANDKALLLPAFDAMQKPISLLTTPSSYQVGELIVLRTEDDQKQYRLQTLLDSSTAFNHFVLSEWSDKNF